jgi:hypothetical protein
MRLPHLLVLTACAGMLHPATGVALEANEILKLADPTVVVILVEGKRRADDGLGSGVIIERRKS